MIEITENKVDAQTQLPSYLLPADWHRLQKIRPDRKRQAQLQRVLRHDEQEGQRETSGEGQGGAA